MLCFICTAGKRLCACPLVFGHEQVSTQVNYNPLKLLELNGWIKKKKKPGFVLKVCQKISWMRKLSLVAEGNIFVYKT